MKKLHILYYIILILIAQPTYGQKLDVAQLLLQSKKHYETQTQLSLLLTYKLYNAPSGGKIIDEIKGQYIKSSLGTFSRYGFMFIYETEKWYWVIDEQEKEIYIKDKTKDVKKAVSAIDTKSPEMVETYLKLYKKSEVKEKSGTEFQILFSEPTNPLEAFKKVAITVRKSGDVSQLSLLYNSSLKEMGIGEEDSNPLLQIQYTPSQEEIHKDLFNYTKYFTVTGNQYLGVGKYKTYSIKNF